MSEADAFLMQARSDFNVFLLLGEQGDGSTPLCHALQHLQMATEKLAKAIRLYIDPEATGAKYSHVAFREIAHILKRGDIARRLGWSQDPQQFIKFLDRRRAWFLEVERLSPSVGTAATASDSNGPNVEYPWKARDADGIESWIAPSAYTFPIEVALRSSSDGALFISLVRKLLDRVPEALT